jgi:predicted DNA-binding transcriptional regulator AlpA
MTADVAPTFMLKEEVEKIHPVSDRSRKRAEMAGLFPHRVALAPHKAGWRRSEVLAWEADPASWAAGQSKSANRAS